MKKIQSLIFLGVFTASIIHGQEEDADSVAQSEREKWVGKPAPVWSLKRPDGNNEFLQNWTAPLGRQLRKPMLQPDRHVIVLVFYGSWCPPCIKQLDPLEELHQKYKDEKIKFFVVDNTELARRLYSDSEWEGFKNAPPTKDLFIEKGITMAILEEKNHFVFRKHEIDAIPTIFVIDKSQTIQDFQKGFTEEKIDEFKAGLSEIIDGLLAKQ